MTIENLERANKIQYRLEKLAKMKRWISGGASICLQKNSLHPNDNIELSDTMCSALNGLCIEEMTKLKKEFAEL